MRPISIRHVLAISAVMAAVAACSDVPTSTEQAPQDPAAARASALLGPNIRLVKSTVDRKTTRLGGSGGATAQSGPFDPPPIYCEAGNTNPYCPQIIVGAAVWSGGNANGSTAYLYAHLDAMQNIADSELNVSQGVIGGCTGSPGWFATDTYNGGSNASMGGAYALVHNRTATFTGGSAKWSVSAYGRATGTYGNFTEDWASDVECI